MQKYLSILCIAIILTPMNVTASEITLLEAFHIAEIHTTHAVEAYSIQTYQNSDHYVLDVPADDVMKQVWIHKNHGRVAKIEVMNDGSSTLEYHWPGIKVVAHRGGVGLGVPENTLPAIEKAIEVGAQLIEIDIRETKDGHLVLMHDSTVNRTTNGSGRVDQLTLEEIKKLDAGSWVNDEFKGTIVPTLQEALELMKGRIDPDLDFKEGNIEKLVAVVNSVGIAEQCTHHNPSEVYDRLQKLEPRIFIRPTIQSYADIPGTIRSLRPPMVNMDWKAVSERSIRETHTFGIKAFVNCLSTADTILNARIAAEAGADYIQTDFPDKVIELLREMGLMYDKKWDIGERRNPLVNKNLRYPLW